MTISVTELQSRPTAHSEINFPICIIRFMSYIDLENVVYAISSFVLVHNHRNLHEEMSEEKK